MFPSLSSVFNFSAPKIKLSPFQLLSKANSIEQIQKIPTVIHKVTPDSPQEWFDKLYEFEQLYPYIDVNHVVERTQSIKINNQIEIPRDIHILTFKEDLSKPLAALYSATTPQRAWSIHQILSPHRHPIEMENIWLPKQVFQKLNKATFYPEHQGPHTMFYTIKNLHNEVSGLGFPKQLMKGVIENYLPTSTTKMTLSPIVGFPEYLVEKWPEICSQINNKTLFSEDGIFGRPPPDQEKDMERLNYNLHSLNQQQPVTRFKSQNQIFDYIKSTDEISHPYSIILGKLLRKFLLNQECPISRFHQSNGAKLFSVNFCGDLSPSGYEYSFGFMANYLYPNSFYP